MNRSLKYKCPECGWQLGPVHGMRTATRVVTRKCLGCRIHWQLVVKPVAIKQGWADVATFAKLPAKETR